MAYASVQLLHGCSHGVLAVSSRFPHVFRTFFFQAALLVPVRSEIKHTLTDNPTYYVVNEHGLSNISNCATGLLF